MQCLRGIAKAYDRQQNMQMMYIVYAVVLDGKVATTDLTLSVPLTDERLKALEAAARSIRPSTD
jgi:hypothetical protein